MTINDTASLAAATAPPSLPPALPPALRLDDVPDTAPGVLSKLPVDVLAHLYGEAEQRAASAAQLLGALHGALTQRYADGLNSTGTHHRIDGGYRVTINVPKRVEWDQAALASAVEKLRGMGEEPTEYVEHKLSVQERKYQAWPAALRDLFDPARTEKQGKPSFAFAAAATAEREAA